MLDALIAWSLANRRLVVALAAGLVAWGAYSASLLPVDVLPDLTAPTLTVVTEHPGMSTTDMELQVTFPVETALNGAPGVRRVRSATAVGVSMVWVEFDWGQDAYRARQTVAERLGRAAVTLPAGTARPTLGPTQSIMGEILFVALQSDRHDDVTLRTMADTVIRRRLLAIPGVAQVTSLGGGRKQYHVLLSPDRLMDYDVSLAEARRALADASANTSAGFRAAGGQEHLIRAIAQFTDLDQVRQSVVRADGAIAVTVGNLAEVRAGEGLRRGDGGFNGESAVVIGIRKEPYGNTLDLTEAILAELGELEAALPEGARIRSGVFRQSDFIEAAIANLREALTLGSALVLVVVAAFMANARGSAIALLALPLSLSLAFLGLRALGLTINSMTLGGLAIAIGELVDDALIDVENVSRRLRLNSALPADRRLSAMDVVFRGSSEVRGAVAFGTLIVILVLAPVLFLESVERMLLLPLAAAYVIALLASLAVALTVTPALCSYWLPGAKSLATGRDTALVRLLKRAYRPVLGWSLSHCVPVCALAAALLGAAVAGFGWMGRTFLPEFNEGSLTISFVAPPGTSLEASGRLGAALEAALLPVPEVVSTGRRTGRAESDDHLQGVESSEIDVRLRASSRPREEVIAEIRQRASLLPGTSVTIGQPITHRIDHMLSGSRSSIAVKIFGPDLERLRALAADVQEAMQGAEGVVDLVTEQLAEIPAVAVRFRRDQLARYALPAGVAAEDVRTVFLGSEVSAVREGQISVPLVVRMEEGVPEDLGAMRGTMIDTPSGARVPLGAVARISEEREPNLVSRENAERRIIVSCNVAGGDLRGVVDAVQRRIAEEVQLPPGYRIEYGGQFENERRATRRLLAAGALVLVGIAVLLATVFRSWADGLIVLCNLPLALVGGVAGVFLADGILSVASLLGFVTVFGVASRNGIMLVSHIRHIVTDEGVTDLREAVTRGASERLAPILMTALSTAIALLPVGLALGEPGSEIHAPLALVVMCGLASSTALNMLVVPAVYFRFGRFAR